MSIPSVNELNDKLKYGIALINNTNFIGALDTFYSILPFTNERYKVFYNIGLTYRKMSNFEKALDYIDKSIQDNPSYVAAYISKFETLAQSGNYFEAFKYQEYWFADNILFHPDEKISLLKRLDIIDPYVRHALGMRFHGECDNYKDFDIANFDVDYNELYDNVLNRVRGKVIHVMSSQGLGDVIQASYYVKELLKYKPKKIIFSVRNELVRLLWDLDSKIEITNLRPLEEEYDYFIPIFSLMKILRCNNPLRKPWIEISKKDTFYSNLVIKNAIIKSSQEKLNTGLKIGIIWKGNPNHSNDYKRSISLGKMLNVINDIDSPKTIFSLQLDTTQEERTILDTNNIIDLTKNIRDLYDMASFMENMDMIISIDSAPVHVCGSLGVKTYMIIPKYFEDWRWGTENLAWYENLKIYRI